MLSVSVQIVLSDKVQGTLEVMGQHATRRSGNTKFEAYLLLGAYALHTEIFHSALRRLQISRFSGLKSESEIQALVVPSVRLETVHQWVSLNICRLPQTEYTLSSTPHC